MDDKMRAMIDSIYNQELEYKEQELIKDESWIEATKRVYSYINDGAELDGTPEEIGKIGMDLMGEFNYNISLGTVPMAMAIKDAPEETALMFHYMMDAYDKKDISMSGVARLVKEIGTDPSTILGVGTLGWAFTGKAAVKQATKEGVKSILREKIAKYFTNTTAVAATEGALYGGIDDAARQTVSISSGVQDEYSFGQTAIASGVGAGVGAGGVQGAKFVGKKIGKFMQNTEEEMMKMAGGGTPPQIPINQRLKGDMLLDAEDMIDDLKEANADVDDFGYVTVYHRTSKENAEKIKKTGKMINKEKGIFVSTKKDGSQAEGYGDAVIEMKIPIEDAEIDDMFGDESHLAIKTKTIGKPIDISKYLIQ